MKCIFVFFTEDLSMHNYAGFPKLDHIRVICYYSAICNYSNSWLVDVYSDKCVDEYLHAYALWYKCYKTIIFKCSKDTQAV